jgi:hypothetical protein
MNEDTKEETVKLLALRTIPERAFKPGDIFDAPAMEAKPLTRTHRGTSSCEWPAPAAVVLHLGESPGDLLQLELLERLKLELLSDSTPGFGSLKARKGVYEKVYKRLACHVMAMTEDCAVLYDVLPGVVFFCAVVWGWIDSRFLREDVRAWRNLCVEELVVFGGIEIRKTLKDRFTGPWLPGSIREARVNWMIADRDRGPKAGESPKPPASESAPLGSRKDRMQCFIDQHQTSRAAVADSARVGKTERIAWEKGVLPATRAESQRLEKVLTNDSQYPLLSDEQRKTRKALKARKA